MPTPRSELLAGVRAELPILLGVLPFGMVYGATARDVGLPVAETLAMSSVVFAGSAQFVIVQLLEVAAPWLIIATTAILVNLRHVLYSASLAPYMQHLPLRWKLPLAYLLTDEAYAVSITHYADARTPLAPKHWYFLGAGLALWGTWNLSTLAGILLGEAIPPAWSLDFSIPLTFLALVIPAVTDRASRATVATAGVLVLLLAWLPFKLGLILATLAGIAAGVWLEGRGGAAARGDEPGGEEGR